MCYYAGVLEKYKRKGVLVSSPFSRFQAKVIWIHCCELEAVHWGGRSMWQKLPLLWHPGNQRRIGMNKEKGIFSQTPSLPVL